MRGEYRLRVFKNRVLSKYQGAQWKVSWFVLFVTYYCGGQRNAMRHITHVVGFAAGTWRIGTRGRARNRREVIIKMDLKILRLKVVYYERHKYQAFVDKVRTFGLHKMRGTLDNIPSSPILLSKKHTPETSCRRDVKLTARISYSNQQVAVNTVWGCTQIRSYDGHTSSVTVGKSYTRWSVLSTRWGTTGFSSSWLPYWWISSRTSSSRSL